MGKGAIDDDDIAKLFRASQDDYEYDISYSEMPQIGIDYKLDSRVENPIQHSMEETNQIDTNRVFNQARKANQQVTQS